MYSVKNTIDDKDATVVDSNNSTMTYTPTSCIASNTKIAYITIAIMIIIATIYFSKFINIDNTTEKLIVFDSF